MSQPGDARPLLALFGGPEVRSHDGAPVRLTPTHQALLTLVWGHGDAGLTRRAAIHLLWEEEDTPSGRHRLRQVLHEIRARVGVDPVASSGDDVLLPAWDAVRSDVREVRDALEAGALQKAHVFQARGFASRLPRLPGEAFEDWLSAKRTRLRRELRDIAASAWDRHHPRGTWRAAREAAEVLHILDPESEATLRKVVEARAMTGGFEAAEAAYAAFEEAAGGAECLEAETRALIERIRQLSGDRELGPPRDTAPPPPLVGRSQDLEKARGVLDHVRSGGFEFLLIQGESGLGKTRLLDEIRKEAHIKGFRCLQARPVELEHRIPLNPLVDALGHPEVGRHLRELEEPWRAVIAALLPTLPPGMERSEVPPIQESSLSRRLYDAFHMLFTRLAEDEPTLLFIDDLQWADATTIATLQFVQRRWRSGSMGVICTVRPDLATGEEGMEKYLAPGSELPVTAITIEELPDEEAAELVDHVSEGALDARTVRRICALGGHNPFYLVELTRDYLAGRLQMPELPSDALIVPISLRQLVEPRLDALSEAAARALNLLAVWGRWTRLADLAAVTGEALEACLGRVEELERSRLVTVDRNQVRITHELFRGAVYHRLSEARRAMLHHKVADHLLTTEHPQSGELAVHFARAGDQGRAARYGREAAGTALENGAMAEAAHFLELVVENEHDERLRAEATGDLARVLHMKREISRAGPMLELAAARLRAVGQTDAAIRMDIRRIETLAELGASTIDELLGRLQRIKTHARGTGDDEAWALALDLELHLLDRTGRIEAIRKLFDEVRQCSLSRDPNASCVANAALAVSVFFGTGEESLVAARRAVQLAKQCGLTRHLFHAQMRLFVVLYLKGLSRSQEASDLLSSTRDAAEKNGDVGLRFQYASNYGAAEMDAGHFDEAARLFARAEAILSDADDSLSRMRLEVNRGELAYLTGDYFDMLEHYQAAEAILSILPERNTLAPLVVAGVGLGALETGNIREAKRCELEVNPIPDEWCFDPFVFLSFHARLLERRGRTAEAVALLRENAERIAERLPNTALKLFLAEVHVARRHHKSNWLQRAEHTLEMAEALGFATWGAELRSIIQARR